MKTYRCLFVYDNGAVIEDKSAIVIAPNKVRAIEFLNDSICKHNDDSITVKSIEAIDSIAVSVGDVYIQASNVEVIGDGNGDCVDS